MRRRAPSPRCHDPAAKRRRARRRGKRKRAADKARRGVDRAVTDAAAVRGARTIVAFVHLSAHCKVRVRLRNRKRTQRALITARTVATAVNEYVPSGRVYRRLPGAGHGTQRKLFEEVALADCPAVIGDQPGDLPLPAAFVVNPFEKDGDGHMNAILVYVGTTSTPPPASTTRLLREMAFRVHPTNAGPGA